METEATEALSTTTTNVPLEQAASSAKSLKAVTSDSYVALLNTSLAKPDLNLRIIGTSNARTYAVSDASPGRVFELCRIEPRFGSWFIGDRVQQDGSILLTSPVNPLYLLLPNLLSERRPVPLDSLLSAHASAAHPLDQTASALISELSRDESHVRAQLVRVCDTVRVPGTDLEAFSLNRARLLDWLVARVRAARSVLEREHLVAAACAQPHEGENAADQQSHSQSLAFQLVARQLPPANDEALALRRELHERLSQEDFFGKPASATSASAATGADGSLNDTPSLDTAAQTAAATGANARKGAASKSVSVKARQMAAAAKGSASISSFFAPR